MTREEKRYLKRALKRFAADLLRAAVASGDVDWPMSDERVANADELREAAGEVLRELRGGDK